MLITYFDEVKYCEGVQPYYWLCGITATAEMIWRLEQQVSDFAKECFGVSTLSRETEFHAAEIFHRKRNFKSWSDISRRLGVLKRLAEILNSEPDMGKIFARLEPAKMLASDFEQKAFMFFIERVEGFLVSRKQPGILIGDRENDKVSGVFAESLSHYRENGTSYQFGMELKHLIDTVHFTDSHHSRMLQLADVYAWLLQSCVGGDQTEYPRSEIVGFVRDNTNLLSPDRYKIWPTEQSWLRV